MASENVLTLTDTNFDTEVLQSQIPVLVDFWAVWCGPCRMVAPVVDALAEEYKGRVKVGKVDTDSNRSTAMRFQIQSIPTLMILREQVIVFSQPGALPGDALEDLIGQAVNLDMDEVHREIAGQEA